MAGAEILERETSVMSRSLPGSLGRLTAEPDRVRIFWRSLQRVGAGATINPVRRSVAGRLMVVSGWTCECRVLPRGGRQVFSLLLAGDILDAARRDRSGAISYTSLTPVELADPDRLIGSDPGRNAAVLEALDAAGRSVEDRLLDHLVRIGRLSARERVLHLLLELCERLEALGLVKDGRFRLPLTQELFADALGLSVVHTNRTLNQLQRSGRITLVRGVVTLHDREKLAGGAYFEARSRLAPGAPRPEPSRRGDVRFRAPRWIDANPST